MTWIAVLQSTTDTNPAENAAALVEAVSVAADRGAVMLFTPEMSGLLDRDRDRARKHVVLEDENPVLDAVRNKAAQRGIWAALGSLAIKREDGRWANRSLLVDGTGSIVARYDKIHMFDVRLADGENWNEFGSLRCGK